MHQVCAPNTKCVQLTYKVCTAVCSKCLQRVRTLCSYRVQRYLRELIVDESAETGIGGEQRLHVLEWATALTALPCGGLKDPITIKLWEDGDDNDLPSVHTCTHEVHLPAYSSREKLREKIMMAIAHRHDGFHIE